MNKDDTKRWMTVAFAERSMLFIEGAEHYERAVAPNLGFQSIKSTIIKLI